MTQSDRRRFGIRSAALLVMALTALGTAGARADTYPNRPVRLIVPFAAGGLNDVVARLVAPYLERSLGQPFIVDNRPAASGIVGTDAVLWPKPLILLDVRHALGTDTPRERHGNSVRPRPRPVASRARGGHRSAPTS